MQGINIQTWIMSGYLGHSWHNYAYPDYQYPNTLFFLNRAFGIIIEI